MLRSRKVFLSATFTALALAAATGCSTSEETLYCGDDERQIYTADNCDGDDNSYFIYYGSYGQSYGVGQQLPNDGKRINSTDRAAREKIGIPPRGGFGGTGSKLTGGTGG